MREYSSATRLSGILIVILTAIAFAMCTWFTFKESPAGHYPLDLDGAQWIRTLKNADVGYFVCHLTVDTPITDAWIALAAAENATLYVNGVTMGTVNFDGLIREQVFDCSSTLQTGANIIALRVQSRSYGSPAVARLKLVHFDPWQQRHEVVSDPSWIGETVEIYQNDGQIAWTSLAFDHSDWPHVLSGNAEKLLPVSYPRIPNTIITNPVRGEWIWHADVLSDSVTFTRTIDVRPPLKDAFLGLASAGTIEVTVNGDPLTRQGIMPQGTLTYLPLKDYLRSGKNELRITTRCRETWPGLLVEGLIVDYAGTHRFHSDENWETAPLLSQGSTFETHQDGQVTRAVHLADYPAAPWGVLGKSHIDENLLAGDPISRYSSILRWFAGHALAFLLLWLISGWLIGRRGREHRGRFREIDAACHLPVLLIIGLFLLLRYDIDGGNDPVFSTEFCLSLLIILLVVRALGVGAVVLKRLDHSGETPDEMNHASLKQSLSARKNLLLWSAVIGVILLGIFLRLDTLTTSSMSHDEISMMYYTQGLLKKGYPHRDIGPLRKVLTTYELLPYSIALPVAIMGMTDMAGRLHSVFWGGLSILLVFLLGRRFFDRSIGFLAALIMAIHPWCIIWSQNAFYPQMAQVMALCAALFLGHLIDQQAATARSRNYLLTALFFCLTYLTWEGTGFFLVGLAVAFLLGQRDFSWMRERMFWLSALAVTLIIILQQMRRMFYQEPYLVIGTKLADVGLPRLAFLAPAFDGFFYLRNFLFIETNVLLSCCAVCGIFIARKQSHQLLVTSLLAIPLAFMALTLANTANRYAFYLQGFLVLCGSAGCLRSVRQLTRSIATDLLPHRLIRSASMLLAASILVLFSTNCIIKPWLLSVTPETPSVLTRTHLAWNNYRDVNKFVESHYRPGDTVFLMMPHTFEYYTGLRGDYSLTTLMTRTVVFQDQGGDFSGYTDKFVGIPAILSLEQFERIVINAQRTWFIAIPDIALSRDNDPQTTQFIRSTFASQFESYGGRVYLADR